MIYHIRHSDKLERSSRVYLHIYHHQTSNQLFFGPSSALPEKVNKNLLQNLLAHFPDNQTNR